MYRAVTLFQSVVQPVAKAAVTGALYTGGVAVAANGVAMGAEAAKQKVENMRFFNQAQAKTESSISSNDISKKLK